MFPYKDENPTFTTPFVTLALIAANLAVWVFIQGMGTAPALPDSVCRLGFIPGYLFGGIPPRTEISLGYGVTCSLGGLPAWLTVLTSMFMHGGWMHLIGNVWFLWVFGNNIEDSTGHGRFLVFYLLCGVIAALAQAAADPLSAIPMVGASGAISGVMGGYLILYPHVRVFCFVPPFLFFALPAWTMLLYWLGLQFFGGLAGLASEEGGGVAFWAHAGGFVAGLVLVKFFARTEYVEAHRAGNWSPRRLRAG